MARATCRISTTSDNFLENLAARKLAPARHVPIHGKIQTHPEVLQTLASKPKAAPPATTE